MDQEFVNLLRQLGVMPFEMDEAAQAYHEHLGNKPTAESTLSEERQQMINAVRTLTIYQDESGDYIIAENEVKDIVRSFINPSSGTPEYLALIKRDSEGHHLEPKWGIDDHWRFRE